MLARETGWTYQFLTDEAPMAMLLRIYHAAIWGNGAWTVKRQVQTLQSLFVEPPTVEEEDDE